MTNKQKTKIRICYSLLNKKNNTTILEKLVELSTSQDKKLKKQTEEA